MGVFSIKLRFDYMQEGLTLLIVKDTKEQALSYIKEHFPDAMDITATCILDSNERPALAEVDIERLNKAGY